MADPNGYNPIDILLARNPAGKTKVRELFSSRIRPCVGVILPPPIRAKHAPREGSMYPFVGYKRLQRGQKLA